MNKVFQKKTLSITVLILSVMVIASCMQPMGNELETGYAKTAVPAWDANTAYVAGERVTFNGGYWNAKWWTQGEEPGSVEWGAWEYDGDIIATPTPVSTSDDVILTLNVSILNLPGVAEIIIDGRSYMTGNVIYVPMGQRTIEIKDVSGDSFLLGSCQWSDGSTEMTRTFYFAGESLDLYFVHEQVTPPPVTPSPTATATPRFVLYKSVTYPAENVTETSAYISGATEILPGGGSEGPDISAELYYWEKGNSENKILAANIPFTYQLPVSLGANLTGLVPNTTYEFAFTTNNPSGHTPSNPLSFTTFAEEPPPTPTSTLQPSISVNASMVGGNADAGEIIINGIYWPIMNGLPQQPGSKTFEIYDNPNDAYEFEGWVWSDGSTEYPRSLVLDQPVSVEITFASIPAWDASAVYNIGDKVFYDGNTYEAKWWTQGEIPGSNEWGAWKVLN